MKGFKSRLLKTFKSLPHVGHNQKQNKYEEEDDDDDGYSITSRISRIDLDDESLFEPTPAPTYGRMMIIPPSITPSPLNPNNSFKRQRTSSSTLEQLLYSDDPLRKFEDRCPPKGSDCVVFYTTTIRGIRRTFEDCSMVRAILENLNVVFHERDISMDLGYREEMWRILGWRATPPRLFIRGKYIGGAEVTMTLNEQGKLLPLLKSVPKRNGWMCESCGGSRFKVCYECDGSRKRYDGERNSTVVERCPVCNENGLLPCPVCT